MATADGNTTGIGSFFAGLASRGTDSATAQVDDQVLQLVEAAILNSADVSRLITMTVLPIAGAEFLVAAKVDVSPELSMRQVSVVLNLAERRVREAVPAATSIYIAPEVWIDPNAAQPTTSAIVLKSGN